MKRVKLSSLLEGVRVGSVSNRALLGSMAVTSISTDSRSLKRGDLFLAIRGERHDGHAFVADAVKGGCSCVVFEDERAAMLEEIAVSSQRPLLVGVDDTRRCYGVMARNYLACLSLRRIAVTGSAGKTTTARLIGSVLARRYRVVTSPKSFNNDIGVPKTILSVEEDTDVLVQEMGTNHPGEIAHLTEILGQDHALITNIGPAHVGFFGSEERIAREKRAAVERLGREGTAFLNAEDRFFDFLKEGTRARVLSFGLSRGDLFPERIEELGLERSQFVLEGEKVRAWVSGRHGIANAVAAALVGKSFGLSIGEVKEGIEGFSPEEGRGNVFSVGGVTVIDESYNANPLSVRASLEHFGRIETQGDKIFVFADMLELGELSEVLHRGVADSIVSSGVRRLFTFGGQSGFTSEECSSRGFEEVGHFTTIDDLVARLKSDMKRGDAILVKGSRGMRLERVVQALLNR